MTEELTYQAPVKSTRCHFTVSGSRFIANLIPVASEEAVNAALALIRAEFPDATHHTYAYRIGAGRALVERSSDDREPAGTAGSPMLQVLQGGNISDALIIATRYFGGTKLGIGGLIRAYRDCARLPLAEAVLAMREPLSLIFLTLRYEDLGAVSRHLETLSGTVVNVDYSASVTMQVQLPTRSSEEFINCFESSCRGQGTWEMR
jgi:uncharacterized YigZ family protein